MEKYLIEMFGGSLLLTIAVELAAAFFFYGERKSIFCRGCGGERELSLCRERREERVSLGSAKREKLRPALLIVLVNVLTNPPAVLICWLAGVYLAEIWRAPVQILVETAVVAGEACIYCNFAEDFRWRLGCPVRYAVTANLCSWLTGLLLMAARAAL